MNGRPTESLRTEHRALAHHLERLRLLADRLTAGVQNAELLSVFDWLVSELLPHAVADEEHLYPLVDTLISEHGRASATMVMDHAAIREKVRLFGEAVAALARGAKGREAVVLRDRVRILANQLEALISLHMRKEEAVYFGILDKYATAAQVEELQALAGKAAPGSPVDESQEPHDHR